MSDLMNIGSTVLPQIPQIPLLNIKIEDIRIDIEPSDIAAASCLSHYAMVNRLLATCLVYAL